MLLIAIIIPCYNEAQRLTSGDISRFLQTHANYHFVLVDDGSTDNTGSLIDTLQVAHPNQLTKLTINTNKGKANAVREGIRFSLRNKIYAFIGYLDADFATGLDELLRLTNIVIEQQLDFVFGSRMKKLNASIQRSGFRHITGRIITTLIDTNFNLGIYDTQCGAKIFSSALAEIITNKPFITEWLFDVEIFLRIREHGTILKGEEVPLRSWTSRKGSKVNIFSAPRLVLQFFNLLQSYPSKKKSDG